MRYILLCLILCVSCVQVPEPSAVSPERYGRIICSGYRFKSDEDRITMRIIFKVFHANVEKYATLTDFREAWIRDSGGHKHFIDLYFSKLNEETSYSEKSEEERLSILQSFQNGLVCNELNN